MKQLSEWLDEVVKDATQAQERMLIDDVIDIYNGEYEDYDSYIKFKGKIIKHCIGLNQKNEMSICVEPILLAEPIFNYIKDIASLYVKENK